MELPSPLPIAAYPPAPALEAGKPAKIRKIITYSLFGLLVLFSYANQLIYRYQVPPGGDGINHNIIVTSILAGHWRSAFTYHIVWHLMIAGLALITHARSITVMAWLGPLLLVSGGVTLYYFNKKYFGWAAGITALILFSFFSRQPLQTLYDGGFPDVLAGATVLPLVLMAVENVSGSSRKGWAVGLLLISLLVLLYSHHLTFLFAVALLAIYLIIQLVLTLHRRGWRWWQLVLIGLGAYAAAVIIGGLFLNHTETSAASLARMFMAINWRWPFIHLIGQVADPNQIFDITAYPNALGESLVYLGLGGLAVAIGYFLQKSDSPRGRVSLLLLVWLTVLALGSRNPHLGFPSRLMRDLAIPLTLLAGVFIQAVTDFCQSRRLPRFLLATIIVLSFATGWLTLFARVGEAVRPNPLVYHLAGDRAVVNWMNANLPAGSTILSFPGDIYLPLFLNNQKVLVGYPAEDELKITDPTEIPRIFPRAQYVYFQYRLDQPTSDVNNLSNLETYKGSETLELLTDDISPQEEVYIFRVVGRSKGLMP
ncbi:MAG TPA: hypothetical protein VLE93_00185 [Candidatus Saccharimonadales bacterium]|nr:hypothetical protein [Candidatus Saccharimonadales bacterium]